jgi:hypothetical protein
MALALWIPFGETERHVTVCVGPDDICNFDHSFYSASDQHHCLERMVSAPPIPPHQTAGRTSGPREGSRLHDLVGTCRRSFEPRGSKPLADRDGVIRLQQQRKISSILIRNTVVPLAVRTALRSFGVKSKTRSCYGDCPSGRSKTVRTALGRSVFSADGIGRTSKPVAGDGKQDRRASRERSGKPTGLNRQARERGPDPAPSMTRQRSLLAGWVARAAWAVILVYPSVGASFSNRFQS